ncbi:Hemin transport protein [Lysobacter sp. A6]|uniref:Hemin transport protein n=1 Tax=Noviluteimonas lactosilytica TaxID=2888523 RepID=A0ABS8JEC3_9GAMM|nr:Hemin transport protein [Lysobacter lactosilyticus]MCC8361955.1 Hemin transport protein [Lysobacter lactosilyticus]
MLDAQTRINIICIEQGQGVTSMMWHARTTQVSEVAPRALPTSAQLASLGPVLCLYRVQPGGALSGWAQASHCEVVCRVDCDGPCEAIHFFDAQGRVCWRLYLLPDSDFLGWDALTAPLRARSDGARHGARWYRLVWRLRRKHWRADILTFRDAGDGGASIGAERTHLSPFGNAIAARIARREGLTSDGFDCCCQHHAFPLQTPL